MSWGPAFIRALDAEELHSSFRVICLDGPDTTYASSPTFAELEGDAPAADVIMGVEGPQISGEGLQLPDVSCSHGAWSWTAVASNLSRLIQSTRKGRILGLEMRANGEGWERVALGAVESRSFSTDEHGAALKVNCAGMGALLGQRYTVGTGQRSLFRETVKSGVLGSAYTAGDGTVTLVSTAEWAEFDGVAVYYFRIYPSDGTSSFVLRATGRTATTFTGVGASAVWDTTEVDALSGSEVGIARGCRLSGSYSAADATINVTASAPWSGLDGDGYYYLRIYPTPSADPFVVVASGRTATTFTGCFGGRLATVDHNASTHDEVQLVRVVRGHPVECALKVLQSTGAGTNGPWDTLPADWGMALPRTIIDDLFSRLAIAASLPSSGDTLFEIEVGDTTSITDAGEWIRSWLAPFGGFITFRQGSIVVRVLVDPVKVGGRTVLDLDGDSDFFELSGELDSPDYDAAYTEVVHHAEGVRQSSEEAIGAASAESVKLIEVAHMFTNLSASLAEISQRTALYWHRVPCPLRLRCVGLRAAQVAPGDLVYLSSRWAQLIPDASKSTAVNRRGCVVVQVNPILVGVAVELELMHFPDTAGV